MKQNLLFTILALSTALFSTAQHRAHVSGNPPLLPIDISVFSFGHSLFKNYPFNLAAEGQLSDKTESGSFYTASVKKGKLHGLWQSNYANGQLLDKGQLVKGIPNGEWKVWNAAGELVAIRNYDADLFWRVKREVELNHPKQYSYALTARYKKQGRDAVKYMQAGYSFIQQRPLRTKDISQLVELNSSDPEHYHPVFNDCLHHGLYMNFNDNGTTLDSGYYKAGLREGVWVHRTNDGLWKGAYKNGTRYNEWKLYDTNGKLHLIIFYNRNGKEEGRKKIGV